MEMPRLSENLMRIKSPPPASSLGRLFRAFRHVLLALAGALLLAPGLAQAAGQLLATGGGWNWDGNVLHLTSSSNYNITMASAGTTTYTDSIVVDPGVTANITLTGVKIDLSSSPSNPCAFCIIGATVNLSLVGNNTLASGSTSSDGGYEGVSMSPAYSPDGSTLLSTLTISGTGSLTATGSRSYAGIGGTYGYGAITINSGTITATGNPGIGGSCSGGGLVTINGGTITAYGDASAFSPFGVAGVSANNLTINGGTVNATGGDDSYNILGGDGIYASTSCGDVIMGAGILTINGGTINATGGSGGGAGIGGSSGISTPPLPSSYGITIAGGTVTAHGGDGGGPGIVARYSSSINITGNANVTAISGSGSATVGAGAPIGDAGSTSAINTPIAGSGISPIAAPADASAAVGGNASFTVSVATTGTAPLLSYQWQVSADGGTTWANVPSATAPTLTLNNVTATMYGYQYHCVVTVTGGGLITMPNGAPNTITYTTHPAKLLVASSQFTANLPSGAGTMTATVSGGGSTCVFNPSATQMIPSGSAPAGQPVQFPYGLLAFELTGCTAGSTVTVTTTWPSLSGVTGYFKYGPTPTSGGQSVWYTPNNVQIAGNTITYTVRDGGLGDDDLSANGVIRDPGGPGIPLNGNGNATPVPTLTTWALAALAMALGWMALALLPGRRKG